MFVPFMSVMNQNMGDDCMIPIFQTARLWFLKWVITIYHDVDSYLKRMALSYCKNKTAAAAAVPVDYSIAARVLLSNVTVLFKYFMYECLCAKKQDYVYNWCIVIMDIS